MIISSAAAAGMAATALGMVLTPGPNMMYLVSRSISQGRMAGLVSLTGTATGFVVYMVMANLGLATVFVLVPALYICFKATGAVYIAYLAYGALRPGGAGLFEPRALERDSNWRLYRMGLITNLLNPKAAILYLALIPEFIQPAAGHVIAQGFALGGIQMSVSLTVNTLLILAAGSIATFLAARPQWTRLQRRVTGALLGAIVVMLAREVPSRARV
ncbi:MAG TPA: LysE family translocator [Solirubrobacteraceae bacterium]|nr:LysE family translocator [Solirubrobacteraceae bacterium]